MKTRTPYHTTKPQSQIVRAPWWPVNTQVIVSADWEQKHWCVRLLPAALMYKWLWWSALHVASQTRNNLVTLKGHRPTAGLLISAVSLCCHEDSLAEVSVFTADMCAVRSQEIPKWPISTSQAILQSILLFVLHFKRTKIVIPRISWWILSVIICLGQSQKDLNLFYTGEKKY